MHPPFGFALFYLRSVAPPTIKTSDIYWGAAPFVVIQVIMVALIIAFPVLVTVGLDRPVRFGPTGAGANAGYAGRRGRRLKFTRLLTRKTLWICSSHCPSQPPDGI
jgi:hypothetical protein